MSAAAGILLLQFSFHMRARVIIPDINPMSRFLMDDVMPILSLLLQNLPSSGCFEGYDSLCFVNLFLRISFLWS